MYKIKVPASSSNLGPGFDTLGIALNLYLTVEIGEETDEWIVEHNNGRYIPTDQHNYIVKTALSISPNLTPHHIIIHSEIPVARGLGSSSSALIAGIVMANLIDDLNLTDEDILNKAVAIEGHPDNVAPIIYGGLVSAMYFHKREELICEKLPTPVWNALAFIPNRKLSTKVSRNVLPDQISYWNGIRTNSASLMLVTALYNRDYRTAFRMMEMDLIHEPYRKELVPELDKIRKLAHTIGIHGTYLSGSGPTILTYGTREKMTKLQSLINQNEEFNGSTRILQVEPNGYSVTNTEEDDDFYFIQDLL
ncbi:homoserine kinase [Xylocopilactobacillus apis]|uniref:Homoserine kinase n=1 Tax=Xylocopilactobacillus apis TaxID=2932183 RepID=A0AAU9D343_9LACO|nr:homoserine kinase [Xylocopilactobacillus apis]BDR56720.1 homoserine kinase [Xylocopilactobacillus apis]